MKKYVIVIIMLLSFWLFWYGKRMAVKNIIYQGKITECDGIIKILTGDLTRYRKQEKAYDSYRNYLKNCQAIQKKQLKWATMLKGLVTSIPPNIWFEEMDIYQNNSESKILRAANVNKPDKPLYYFSLTGRATQPKAIEFFYTFLDTSANFVNASLQTFNQNDMSYKFKITSLVTADEYK